MQLGMSVYLFHLSSPIKLHGLALDSLLCKGKQVNIMPFSAHLQSGHSCKTIGPAHSEFGPSLDISLPAMFHEEMFPR